MIIVHGLIPIREDRRDEALAAAERMADATRDEDGCITYEFYVGLTDPNTLLLFQEWEDMDSLSGHFETEHMEEFLRVLPVIAAGEIMTRRFQVQGNGEIDEQDESADFDEEDAPRIIH